MSKVEISKKDLDKIAVEFYDIKERIDVLSDRKEELRQKLINLHKNGIDTSSSGILVTKTKRINYGESENKWVAAGKELPMKTIPEHKELNRSKFKALLDAFDEFKVYNPSFTVKTRKRS